MDITLNLNGKVVPFRATVGVWRRYKAQFGREIFADLQKLERIGTAAKNDFNWGEVEITTFNSIAWAMACTASTDPDSFPTPQQWEDSLESLPIKQIQEKLIPALMATTVPDPKNE